MDPRPLNYFASACQGVICRGHAEKLIGRICTDSRHVQAGDLFIALKGDRFDGHQFIATAIRNGADAALVEYGAKDALGNDLLNSIPSASQCSIVRVPDTRIALGEMAARYRRDFTLPIIAVGGSNGKTTTKDLTASVLRQRFATVASEASFNNEIGVPATLFNIEATHEAAVIEAGTNHPGELALLARMIQPHYGMITSIGREHLEFFGDVEGVAREEGALAEALPEDGTLFINGDSEWTEAISRRSRARIVRVGLGGNCDWRAKEVKLDAQGTSFRVDAPRSEWSGEYRVGLLGRHQVVNALLALAAGAERGLGYPELSRGLSECPPPKMRLQIRDVNGTRLINDAYNANADSVNAALAVLGELPCAGKRIAVLGEMAELGDASRDAHREAGQQAAERGVNLLLAVGPMAKITIEAARAAGLRNALECADAAEAAKRLRTEYKTGDLVLLKASRVSRLEKVEEYLRAEEAMETKP